MHKRRRKYEDEKETTKNKRWLIIGKAHIIRYDLKKMQLNENNNNIDDDHDGNNNKMLG